jgi:hypothetical protein
MAINQKLKMHQVGVLMVLEHRTIHMHERQISSNPHSTR